MSLEVRKKTKDGKVVMEFKCPGCSRFGEISEDQYHGKAEFVCGQKNPDCSFKAVIDVAERVAEAELPKEIEKT